MPVARCVQLIVQVQAQSLFQTKNRPMKPLVEPLQLQLNNALTLKQEMELILFSILLKRK